MIPHKLTLCLLLFFSSKTRFRAEESLRLGASALLSMSGSRRCARRRSSTEDSCAAWRGRLVAVRS
jgi:hypothetical protein